MKIVKKKKEDVYSMEEVNAGEVFNMLDGTGPVLRTVLMVTPLNRTIVGVFIETGELCVVSDRSELNNKVKIIAGSFVEE